MKKVLFIFLLFALTLVGCSKSNSNNERHIHSYSTKVVEATCSTDGYTYHYCVECLYGYKDNIIPALGHDYIEREQDYKCSRCGRYEDEGFAISYKTNGYYVTLVTKEALDDGKIILPRKYNGLPVIGIFKGALYMVRSSMEELVIPSNIKYIGSLLICQDGQYYPNTGIVALKTIKFDNNCSNINISHTAFQFCKNVKDISMPNNCIAMINHDDMISNHFLFEDTIFYKNNRVEEEGCYYLFNILLETDKSKVGTTVTIKNGTRIISNQAFAKNTNIRTVELPSSLIYIGMGAFAQCMNLSKIIYHGTEKQYNSIIRESNSFEDCKTITYQFS